MVSLNAEKNLITLNVHSWFKTITLKTINTLGLPESNKKELHHGITTANLLNHKTLKTFSLDTKMRQGCLLLSFPVIEHYGKKNKKIP